MSLLYEAYRTYNLAEDRVGVDMEEEKEPLSPIFHTVTNAGIDITITNDGKFVQADIVNKEDVKTIIPVTVDSAGRSGKKFIPHPLCDQYKYLCPDNEELLNMYISQLQDWESSEYTHPILSAVLKYVSGKTIASDIADTLERYASGKKGKANEQKKEEKKSKCLIRWIVIGLGDDGGPCWKNKELRDLYIKYYSSQTANGDTGICMITGENTVLARIHPKNIIRAEANAKLISANDTANFVYRGRFVDKEECLSVGLVATQKAHNALHWVAANQGLNTKSGCIVAWSPEGKKLPRPAWAMSSFNREKSENCYTPSDYKNSLSQTVYGWKRTFDPDTSAVIAGFESMTSGRLSVTYYNEMNAAEFVDALSAWDESCCWVRGSLGICAASVYDLAKYSCGKYEDDKMVADGKFFEKELLSLTMSRIGRGRIPAGVVKRLVAKCGSLFLYDDTKENSYVRSSLLFNTCAALRKYKKDYLREEWEMALEPDKKDRGYQYGRLLAVLEKAERDTYSKEEKREPKAICMMGAFTRNPRHVGRILTERVKATYFRRLSPGMRTYYSKIIDHIWSILSELPDENRPLEDSYLFGYSLQKNALYTKKQEADQEGTEESL